MLDFLEFVWGILPIILLAAMFSNSLNYGDNMRCSDEREKELRAEVERLQRIISHLRGEDGPRDKFDQVWD